MTLPETLKSARIEAMTAAVDEYGMALTLKNIARLLEAYPLEQIAVELVEALKEYLIVMASDGEEVQAAYEKGHAALQKAGVR